MPYKTKDGFNTSLKIAIGNNIAVNAIVGYPFLSSAGFKLNMSDLSSESTEFDKTFQMKNKPAQRSLPKELPEHAQTDSP
eukprot:392999-Ditylum_brightwellii.AAC.1